MHESVIAFVIVPLGGGVRLWRHVLLARNTKKKKTVGGKHKYEGNRFTFILRILKSENDPTWFKSFMFWDAFPVKPFKYSR